MTKLSMETQVIVEHPFLIVNNVLQSRANQGFSYGISAPIFQNIHSKTGITVGNPQENRWQITKKAKNVI